MLGKTHTHQNKKTEKKQHKKGKGETRLRRGEVGRKSRGTRHQVTN